MHGRGLSGVEARYIYKEKNEGNFCSKLRYLSIPESGKELAPKLARS